MRNHGFEGWYFKHQRDDYTLAFIPGRSAGGAFIQMVCTDGSRQFDIPELNAEKGAIRAGGCLFSRQGVSVNLPGVSGRINYGGLTPLGSDIMGPFRHLPMECRHGIISMGHTLSGNMTVDGVTRSFDGGRGYIEMDRGSSFPSEYMWAQCGDFAEPCSVTVSVARIPMLGLEFPGCICAVIYKGREYRLATYRGARIRAAEPGHISLSQGGLSIEIDVSPADCGHALRSPVRGRMSGSVRESCNAFMHVRLWNRGETVFNLESPHAVYEEVLKTGEDGGTLGLSNRAAKG